MSDRHLTRIRQLTALCLLLCAVITIGLAISGALKEGALAGASTGITQMTRGERPGAISPAASTRTPHKLDAKQPSGHPYLHAALAHLFE